VTERSSWKSKWRMRNGHKKSKHSGRSKRQRTPGGGSKTSDKEKDIRIGKRNMDGKLLNNKVSGGILLNSIYLTDNCN